MKHIQAMSKTALLQTPGRADDFTTGEKLGVAAGIAAALAEFFATKEGASS